jgi:phytoene dehydrogenase-like protein
MAWERKGFIFDGCIHYLFGSGEGQPFHQMWEELGAVQNRAMINHEEFMRVVDPDGKTLIAFCDPDRLEAHLCELSPSDAARAKELAEGIRQFTKFDMSVLNKKPRSLMGLDDWMQFGQKMTPFMGAMAKWALVSAQDFANRFKDPFFWKAIPHVFGWPEITMMTVLMLLAYMHNKNAGFPAGASLEFARAIEQRYLQLGGVIHYKSQVEKILTEGNRAVGVRLYNNDEVHRADYVVSAADGQSTIFDLLGGKFINRAIQRMYNGHLPIYSLVQISLGVGKDFSSEPHWVTYLLKKPFLIAGEERFEIGVKNYCFDPGLAPVGKSVIEMILRTNYAYWQNIYGHRLYDTEQTQVSDLFIDFLETIYPGIKGEIEAVDEATPLSYERYTNNWQGSTSGFLMTKQTTPMSVMGVRKTLPGLKNFFMAGQWVEPGGSVSLAAASGRNAIQLVCHADGKQFASPATK